MNAGEVTPQAAREVRPGQRWIDDRGGPARVLAVAEGYVMLRRHRRNAFVASVEQMLRGDHGWRREA